MIQIEIFTHLCDEGFLGSCICRREKTQRDCCVSSSVIRWSITVPHKCSLWQRWIPQGARSRRTLCNNSVKHKPRPWRATTANRDISYKDTSLLALFIMCDFMHLFLQCWQHIIHHTMSFKISPTFSMRLDGNGVTQPFAWKKLRHLYFPVGLQIKNDIRHVAAVLTSALLWSSLL